MRGTRLLSKTESREMCVATDEVWAISNVLYFDTRERALKHADIEICDNEIVGITTPGTSSASVHIDGGELVCLPGLVNGCVSTGLNREDGDDDRAARLAEALSLAVSSGVTTVGMFSHCAEEEIAAIAKVGVRANLYREYMDVWLGPEYRPVEMNVFECLSDFEKTVRRFESSVLVIQPAIGSQLAASTQLLTALHEVAKKQHRRWVVRVDGGSPWIESFWDAYGCSGLALLRSLDAVDEHTLIVATVPMPSLEWRHLKKCHASVVYPAHEFGANAGGRKDIARIDIAGRAEASLCWGRSPMLAIDHLRASRSPEFAGDVIDLLTWKGAKALKFPETGSLAVGKRSDLLLYDRRLLPGRIPAPGECAAILDMILRYSPQGVLVDGRWVVRDPGLVGSRSGQPSVTPLRLAQSEGAMASEF
ncbi:cytosine deaminase-like metal-dependent hydrolase [Burkholderia sp. Ch1-1]|nr:cytosine deaminase-like metal-dependent hydrolase [Burkholderia sp. Ch1-1]